VTRLCTLLALLLIGSTAGAEPIGSVSDANGTLLARTATGSIKVLVVGSAVERGETLFTRTGTYARVSLRDRSSVSLGPDTELSVETYSFHEASEDPTDSASLKLARGRVRISSGILGTRHPNSFALTAGATTVDIRRSTFVAEFVQPISGEVAWSGDRATAIDRLRAIAITGGHAAGIYRNVSLHLAQAQANNGNNGGLNPGLYVQVLDGMIQVSNSGGSQNYSAGQFGFTPGYQQPPVILPNNPGIQFAPPPSFSNTGTQNGNGGGKPGEVDCIVR
jgi:FecR protein